MMPNEIERQIMVLNRIAQELTANDQQTSTENPLLVLWKGLVQASLDLLQVIKIMF